MVAGFDYVAIERLAQAKGCPPEATAFFFDAAESAALSAIHDRLKDRENG